MNKEMEKLFSYKGIDKEEIPNIPLYMDQVLGLLNEGISPFAKNEGEQLITKTMINNYVKAKAVSSPIKKKYDREQIMKIAMIFHMKNILSINELKSLFELAENGEYSESKLYDKFLQLEKEQMSLLKVEMSDKEMVEKEEMLNYIMELVIEANFKKVLAENLLKELCKKESID